MRKRLVIAGSVLVAIAVGFAILDLRYRTTPSAAASVACAAATPVRRSATAAHTGAALAHVPTRATVATNPTLSARDWIAHARAVGIAKQAKLFGAEAARLLITLPPSDAWSALTSRVRDGDSGAAAAALLLVTRCRNLPDQVAAMEKTRSRYLDDLGAGLPQDWKTFLAVIAADAHDRRESDVASCAGVGGVLDFALLALDRFTSSDDPNTQLGGACPSAMTRSRTRANSRIRPAVPRPIVPATRAGGYT